ncbi:hypothetical protein IWQ61_000567 [Dispira simplex]|nr:hypothetical protein IWQ61_000567 [Dispira simplex]
MKYFSVVTACALCALLLFNTNIVAQPCGSNAWDDGSMTEDPTGADSPILMGDAPGRKTFTESPAKCKVSNSPSGDGHGSLNIEQLIAELRKLETGHLFGRSEDERSQNKDFKTPPATPVMPLMTATA